MLKFLKIKEKKGKFGQEKSFILVTRIHLNDNFAIVIINGPFYPFSTHTVIVVHRVDFLHSTVYVTYFLWLCQDFSVVISRE